MAGTLLEVTDDTFEKEVIQAERPTLVDFWAPWCAPCRAMTPVVEKLAQELNGQAKIVKLNTQDYNQVPEQYGITAIPTFLVFKGGKVVEQIIGGRSYDELKGYVTKHLG